VSFIIKESALVSVAYCVGSFNKALLVIFFVKPQVMVPVCINRLPLTVLVTILETPFVFVVSLAGDAHFFPNAIELPIEKISIVSIVVYPLELTYAIELVIAESSNVPITALVGQFTLPTFLVPLDITNVPITSCRGPFARPLPSVIDKFPGILGAICPKILAHA
jgi:hypothetical protein